MSQQRSNKAKEKTYGSGLDVEKRGWVCRDNLLGKLVKRVFAKNIKKFHKTLYRQDAMALSFGSYRVYSVSFSGVGVARSCARSYRFQSGL
jgi:hypothetical protein